MHKKLNANKQYAKRMSKIRSKTVEPVLGTLINFLNMKRINTRGIKQANKHVLMAALCYNLKKYMKFIARKTNTKVAAMQLPESFLKTIFTEAIIFIISSIKFKRRKSAMNYCIA